MLAYEAQDPGFGPQLWGGRRRKEKLKQKYMAYRLYLSIFLKGANWVKGVACQVKVLTTQPDNLSLIPRANKTVACGGVHL